MICADMIKHFLLQAIGLSLYGVISFGIGYWYGWRDREKKG